MIPFTREPVFILRAGDQAIPSFVPENYSGADEKTLQSFGDEWRKFENISSGDLQIAFDQYFDIIPENALSKETRVLDIGCGSGRWSSLLAKKVASIEAVDPGPAAAVAANKLSGFENVRVTQTGFGCLPFSSGSFDFVLCLGVVHHIPQPAIAIREIADMLRSGGRMLLYVYYDLALRSPLYRMLYKISALLNRMIFPLPKEMKFILSDFLAIVAAGPFIVFAKTWKLIFPRSEKWRRFPLGYYADKSWRIVRNDSLDRFGSPPAHRFSKNEIERMLELAGFREIRFSDQAPFWHVTAIK